MFRILFLLSPAILLAGCISFTSSEPPAAPDYVTFCQEKEAQCREICGIVGVQAFACKLAPGEGSEYQCQCRKPGGPL
ncbi:MAG TPA: hypothetical protein DEB56_12285 [Thiobacillus sp.]|nr:hypothetical protein [Thiobacillus sp.]